MSAEIFLKVFTELGAGKLQSSGKKWYHPPAGSGGLYEGAQIIQGMDGMKEASSGLPEGDVLAHWNYLI
jgi:hypothetical protein